MSSKQAHQDGPAGAFKPREWRPLPSEVDDSARPDTGSKESTLALEISPTGRIHLASVAGSSDLSPAATTRIRQAFERGSGHGLLHLGAVELATWLPSSLAFGRELGHLFMARLCAVPDLTHQWDSAEIAPSHRVGKAGSVNSADDRSALSGSRRLGNSLG